MTGTTQVFEVSAAYQLMVLGSVIAIAFMRRPL